MLTLAYELRVHTYVHNSKLWERGYSEDKLLPRFAYEPKSTPPKPQQ